MASELEVRQGFANGTLENCDGCGATIKMGEECPKCTGELAEDTREAIAGIQTLRLAVTVEYEQFEAADATETVQEIIRRAFADALNAAMDNGFDTETAAIERIFVEL